MPATLTPLRYPGGKTKFYQFVHAILAANDLIGGTYVEPFAGGAGLAVKLLLNGDVENIVINDLDVSIYSFWRAILDYTDDFCDLIQSTEISIDEWHRQKAVYLQQDTCDVLSLGFATFFLNRTNMSGIIQGGVIGGMQQNGSNAIDARFHKLNLIGKIRRIAEKRDRIEVLNLDAQDLLRENRSRFHDALINLDPPYVKKGSMLYKNSFTEKDHRELAQTIATCDQRWIVTYDICPLVEELYSDYRHGFFDLTYSIRSSKKAQEIVFFSHNLLLLDI